MSFPEIQLHFRDLRPHTFELLMAVREDLLSYLPPHTELIKWGSIAFDKPGAKATVKDNICYLRPRRDRLEIGFGLGVFLKDPDQLLTGNGRYKRQIVLKSFDQFQSAGVKALVLQSYHYDSKRVLYKLLPNDDYLALKKGI